MRIKNISILLFMLLICGFAYSIQSKTAIDKPRVDKNVELLNIVARLAGYNEYSSTLFKLYTDKIDNHFNDYKGHEIIKFLQSLRREEGISYDAVMFMAIHLDENLNPRIEFSDNIPAPRWGKYNATKFVKLLKDFYKESKYEEFFNANESIYQEISKRFIPVYESLDIDWYNNFYGEKISKIILINTPGNTHNYGVSFTSKNGVKEIYAIMGAWTLDTSGMITFPPKDYLPILLHELNHSFINHLLDKNKALFEDSGKVIYNVVEDKMVKLAYGNWEILLKEELVRAAVVKYMLDHKYAKDDIISELKNQVDQGFIWVKPLTNKLAEYDTQRNTYPTLKSFIPELANAYKSFATQVEDLENKRPKIISINELKNGNTNISTRLKRITIHFDQPLLGQGYSINYGNKGQIAFPKFDKISYSDDKKSLLLDVSLEKNKEYQFILTGKHFKSKEGVSIKNYEVNFKTGE